MSAVGPMTPLETIESLVRARLHPLEAWDAAERRVVGQAVASPEDWPRPAGPLHPAAVLVGLVERPEGLTVLLTRRADTLRRHSGQIAFPGGRSDPGETPWATALREAEEEIGLDPGRVRIAGLGDLYETVTGFSITPVVGFVTPPIKLRLEEAEVAEVFEAPFAFLMDRANHERRARDFGDGTQRRYFAIPHDDRLIWGATAGMLRMLSERLFEGDG